jgi:hypothetical protein
MGKSPVRPLAISISVLKFQPRIVPQARNYNFDVMPASADQKNVGLFPLSDRGNAPWSADQITPIQSIQRRAAMLSQEMMKWIESRQPA